LGSFLRISIIVRAARQPVNPVTYLRHTAPLVELIVIFSIILAYRTALLIIFLSTLNAFYVIKIVMIACITQLSASVAMTQ